MSEDQTNLTLRQRNRLQQSAGAAASEPKSRRRYLRTLLAAGLVILLAAGGAWAWMHFNRGNDPRYQELLALQAKANELKNPMSPEAIEMYKQMHEKMKDLPDDLKKQAEENGRNSMQSRFNRFFASSSKDQLAVLDMLILGVQAMQLKNAITGQPPANAGADSGKQGGHGGRTDAQKVQWWQGKLATMSPQQRAQFGLGIQMFHARMQQQGATPPAGGIF